jgi:hypothetical protein
MGEGKKRRSGSALVANIRESEHPAHRTFLMACKNRALALGTLKGCCGHPGEPGC